MKISKMLLKHTTMTGKEEGNMIKQKSNEG
jgi:hypothetical protein